MSDSYTAEEEKNLAEGKGEGEGGEEKDQPVASDDEDDDCEGYFLEPVGSTVNIFEKIAEANKKLLEEAEVEEGNGSRPRKVQFSEDLVNFEPNYYSDDDYTESAQNSIISEEDSELKLSQEEYDKIKSESDVCREEEKSPEHKKKEDIPEEITEEIDSEIPFTSKENSEVLSDRLPKFILVLLPKDQNSSCESIIGEDIPEQNSVKKALEDDKPPKTKIARPKSAKKSWEVSKISPILSCTSNLERKSWGASRNLSARSKGKIETGEKKNMFVSEIKVQIRGRLLKKINIDDLNLEDASKVETLKRCGSRPRSCVRGRGNSAAAAVEESRPKSAPMRRTCCVIKMDLPSYNGLRSEYGLSVEQLQERKQKAIEKRQQEKQELLRKRQEEIKKRNENEETFQKWLFNKAKKNFKKKFSKPVDTLTRSDIYIQTHASYAGNKSVPYSLDYSIGRKISKRKREIKGKKNKSILVEKLFENTTPHFKRSFNIYLGIK